METAFARAPVGLQINRPDSPALLGREKAQPFVYSETPLIKSGEHNLKNIVISVLSRQWPLSARRVYRQVLSDHFQITYQGVHKALRQLREQGIVRRTEEGHQLDTRWIDQLEAYSRFLRSNYSMGKNTDFYGMISGDSACLSFDSYFQAVSAILEIMGREHENPQRDDVCLQLAHPLPIIGLPAATLSRLKRHARTHSFRATYHSDSASDYALCRMWERAGIGGKVSRRQQGRGSYNVLTRGILIQIMPTPQFARRATAILSKGGHESLLAYTEACLDPSSRTLVTITKSPGLAEEIRKERR
ncbi:MAG: hypothetical protein WCX64_02670 [Candidatus Micrarchaeia archaeon]|jgi:hypothetical protein